MAEMDAAIRGVDLSLYSKKDIEKFAIEMARMKAMATAYAEAFKNDFNEYDVVLTEQKFSLPLIEGVEFNGFIDVLMQDAAGDWWVKELKTASSGTVDSDYTARIQIDSQVLSYAWAVGEMLGTPPRGIVYDVVIKTKHSQRKGETVSGFISRLEKLYIEEWSTNSLFIREKLEFSEANTNRWLTETKFIAAEILSATESMDKLRFPKNTGHCKAKWGTCDYFDICVSGRVDKLKYTVKEK